MRPTLSLSIAGATLCALLSSGAMSTAAADTAGIVITDFSGAAAADQWRSINDDVMGGVSKGDFLLTDDDTLMFAGILSLENNGGFASIRMLSDELDLADYDRIAIRLKGDGRAYYLNLMTSSRSAAASYRAPIETEAGTWQEVRIDIDDFRYTYFGRIDPDSGPVDPADIRGLGITLADKMPGPFRMEIDWIKAEQTGAASEVASSGSSEDTGDIVDTAVADGRFTTLVAALQAADLVEALKGPGPFTVFAPTDEAFAKLPDGMVEDLLRPENRDKLTAILSYHVVSGEVSLGASRPNTLQGSELDIQPEGSARVNEANVLIADVRTANGLVQVIDRVLVPELPESAPVLQARQIIELAIDRGVPLFNAGQAEACAAIYEVAISSLLASSSDDLDDSARSRLQGALTDVRSEENPVQQAWVLRYALDDVYRHSVLR